MVGDKSEAGRVTVRQHEIGEPEVNKSELTGI